MFFCDSCAEENNWPTSLLANSFGACEVCSKISVCNDVPSKYLPMPAPQKPELDIDSIT